jgi:hypothetical protein
MDARELEIIYGSNTIRTATWGRGLWENSLVGRENYPSISDTWITNPPSDNSPKENVDQFVSSIIDYSGTLSSVYLEWSKDSAVFGNVISMNNILGNNRKSSQPLPHFAAGTKIYFKVFAVGANLDTTETYKFMYDIQPFVTCMATGTTSSGNLYISSVSLENLINASGNTNYYSYANPVVELYKDSSYSLTIYANTGWSSNDFGVWIDYNNDTDFDQSERILFDLNSGNNTTGSFKVPSNISVDDTVTMRVRLSYWSDPEPCGAAFGEVEDYQVVLKDITTSTLEIEKAPSEFEIFPNPNQGHFTIRFKEGVSNKSIRILNANGQLVYEKKQGAESKIEFDLDLPAGSYFVTTGNGEGRTTLPFSITK